MENANLFRESGSDKPKRMVQRGEALHASAAPGLPPPLPAPPLATGGLEQATGLAQKLGQLEAANRDLQSKSWATLKLLGQPCNFYAIAIAGPSME